MIEQPPEITIDAACAKYGIEQKRILGAMARNDYESPILIRPSKDAGAAVIIDDWRLERLRPSSAEGES